MTHAIATVPSTTPPPWRATGVLLGLLSTGLAAMLARTVVHRSAWHRARRVLPLPRLQAGHVSECSDCAVPGIATIAVLLL
ncbi:hypothetical protein [Streptomyces sp. NPDC055006]